jgi:uncharacterized membrane protein
MALTIVGVVVAVGATLLLATSNNGSLVVLVALGGLLIGAGVAAQRAGLELVVRTPRGSGLWVRVESFRRFLQGSEAEHAEQAARRGVLRQYTAWAVALGEMAHWSKAVQAAGAAIGNIDDSGLLYARLAPSLLVSAHASSVAPSSSSGVSGGVGGGIGGGGGGSW